MSKSLDIVHIEPKRGRIPIYCRSAVGLHSRKDMIRLHPIPEGKPYQELIGLTFMFTALGRGPNEYSIADILRAYRFHVTLPGSAVQYFAKMYGWKMYIVYKEGYYLYRPAGLTLSGEEGDDVCFAILDQYSLDPGFPFWQFGRLLETDKDVGAKQRWSLYRLGVNVPVNPAIVPGWADDIPSEEDLFKMMVPGLWKGTYKIDIEISPFKVHPDFHGHNKSTMLVQLGRAIFDTGTVSYVGSKYLGDKTKSWPEGLWSGTTLTILSGAAKGKEYVVVDNHITGNSPPAGMPPNECLLEVWQLGPKPYYDGVKKGDSYKVCSYFAYNVEQLVMEKIIYDPGIHGQQTLHYTFEIK